MRWPNVTTRTIDEIECVVSVLLAIVFAHLLDARNVSWAAFSGYMVMRGHVSETFPRGVLRIVGTVVGAAIGLAVVPFVYSQPILVALSAAIIGGLGLYRSLTAKHSYAWLFVGLTFVMILFDKAEHPDALLSGFAVTRILEIIAGTSACVLVSAISTVTVRRTWPGVLGPPAREAGWHPHAALHAAEGASALLLLPLIGWLWPRPDLAQAAVTIMAVMLLPLSTIEVSGFMPVTYRMGLRVAGCLAGAAFAFIFVVLGGGGLALLLLGLVIGVPIGRHIENGKGRFAYSGVQFTLALLVVLVPDNYSRVAIDPVYERLLGIILGVALLQPVLLVWHAAFSGRRAVARGRGSDGPDPGNAA